MMEKMGEHLRTERPNALTLFRELDEDGSGTLEPTELAAFLQKLMPDLASADARLSLAHLRTLAREAPPSPPPKIFSHTSDMINLPPLRHDRTSTGMGG